MEYKVAILHDYLNQYGGAERVLEILLEIFPKADIYTLFYDERRLAGKFKANIRKTSFLDIPLIRNNHRLFIPLMSLAASRLKSLTSYDLVISSSAGYAKGFNVKGKKRLCYCHTPLRYAWEEEYMESQTVFPKLMVKTIGRLVAKKLQKWDKKTAKSFDGYIANSTYIAEKMKKYYGIEPEVIYPGADENTFFYDEKEIREEAYLMVGRLVHYKRFDLGIRACEKLGKNLKIVGTGPEEEGLKRIANPKHVEFVGRADDERLRSLYNGARALIFPQTEDFGLVAVEAQMCGLPIIALKSGGAKEIIEEEKTGVFFENQNEDSLIEAIKKFEGKKWDGAYISARAKRFSKNIFKDKMKEIINRYL